MRNRLIPILLLVGALILFAVIGFILLRGGTDGGDTTENGDGTTTPVDNGSGNNQSSGNNEGDSVPTTPIPTLGTMTEVVVSWQTVPRGWQMTINELITDTRPIDGVSSNVFTDIEDVIGLYARTDIYQGETLVKDDFISDPRLIGREDFGPSSMIPSGWTAASVPLNRLSGVGYGLATGDNVDILLSFYFWEMDEQFQTFLHNSAGFILESVDPESGESSRNIVVLEPYGRFETLPNGDLAHVMPSEEDPRPFHVSMLLQNAKVIQIGRYQPPADVAPPTPIPPPDAPTPTPGGPPPTPTTAPPDAVVLALPPQQQLFLKYAVESNAVIQYALRGTDDGQIYDVQNVDINYFLEQFNIEAPPNFNYSVDTEIVPIVPTVVPTVSVPDS